MDSNVSLDPSTLIFSSKEQQAEFQLTVSGFNAEELSSITITGSIEGLNYASFQDM